MQGFYKITMMTNPDHISVPNAYIKKAFLPADPKTIWG